MSAPQKNKTRTTIYPAVELLDHIPKKMKALIKKDMGTPVFIAALFTVVIYRSKLRVHQQKSRKRRYSVCNIHAHTHMQWNITQPQ